MTKEQIDEVRCTLNMYYAHIYARRETITIDEILDIIEVDLNYLSGSDAIIDVNNLLKNDKQ